MKEIKTTELRDTPKGKNRSSPLSHLIREEIRHTAVSQMQTGEEQDNATDYANDRTIKTADRVVSEVGHGIPAAAEVGKHLFMEHLQKEPQISGAMETPIPDEPPRWDSRTKAEAFSLPPEFTSPDNSATLDFKGMDSSIYVNAVPTKSPETLSSNTPQITPNPAFVAKLEAKRDLIEQEISASMQQTVIPAGQSTPMKTMPTDEWVPYAFPNRKQVNTDHLIRAMESGKAFAQESAASQIAEQKAASAPVSGTASKSKEPTLRLRLEDESNKLQIKVKGYESSNKSILPQVQELKAAAKQFAKENEVKGQMKKTLSDDLLPALRNDAVPSETPPRQKSGVKKLPLQKTMSKGKNIPEKMPRVKAFSKAGKNLKLSDKSLKTSARVLSTPSATTRMQQVFISSVEKAKQAEQIKTTARAIAIFTKKAAERSARAAKAIAQATQELISALVTGGGTLLILVVILVVMGFAGMMFASDDDDIEILPISDKVRAFEPIIQKYAKQYGIGEYVLLIEAVMMQESGGRTTDPMQCSECNFNTRYPHAPGSIADPEYSIEVGVQNLADCLQIAGCKNPVDIEHIKLALQGYNYGQGYITWALNKYGEYSKANAIEFSIKTAEQVGWSSYGDKDYIPHVLRYYPLGQIFYDPDTSTLIVEVAASQIGNVGGEPYWRWYGFTERVGWCACFVSWCADQCGYIDAEVFPRFSGPEWGVYWFKQRGQWLGRDATPLPGMIIFYDWDDPENGGQDGVTDHVGIVSHVEGTTVYTIEGNSTGDCCRECTRTIGNYQIIGYGVPAY